MEKNARNWIVNPYRVIEETRRAAAAVVDWSVGPPTGNFCGRFSEDPRIPTGATRLCNERTRIMILIKAARVRLP